MNCSEYVMLQKYMCNDIAKNILKYANEYIIIQWLHSVLQYNVDALFELMKNKNIKNLIDEHKRSEYDIDKLINYNKQYLNNLFKTYYHDICTIKNKKRRNYIEFTTFMNKIYIDSLSKNINAVNCFKILIFSKTKSLRLKKCTYDWKYLSCNPNEAAIKLLKQNQNKINWFYLSRNPNAISLLETNQDKIDWPQLSRNPNAISLLETNQDKINWPQLSRNPNAIFLLEKNIDKIDWNCLSENPNAISLLEKNSDKINWIYLSRNNSIFHLFKQINETNINKLNWAQLSKNPGAIKLLEQYPIKINWNNLSQNPNALDLLKENQDKIKWNNILRNPSIFQWRYNV
jgi:hypothetical protein